MPSLFDFITVACFVGLMVAFFGFTKQDNRTLLQFLLSGIVLAIANQVGNAGSVFLGSALVLAGIGYAFINLPQE
jgi:hypothetical protein